MRKSPAVIITATGAAMLLLGLGAARGGPAPALSSAPPAAFGQCAGCHTVAKGGPAVVGPNLFGVVGAPAGARPGFAYSPAIKGSRIRWDRAKLDAFLTDPRALVPGTKMVIPGVKDAAKRKEIIDYLATLK